MTDPWYKTTFQWKDRNGLSLSLRVPHDVFSTQRIDEGTLLFLEHLPKGNPKSILDMGCGYGALGLPIAARYPEAIVDMVDRDLLAVKWSSINANENNLKNVNAFGSLGFRDLSNDAQYDWVLCNVPARIGQPFIRNLIEEGCAKLNAGGVLSVVVIRDLGTILEEMAKENEWPLLEVARGPRHTIYSIEKWRKTNPAPESADLYFRDQVDIQGMKLDRPFDFGGDDPKRLMSGLPVLFDSLPRQLPSGGFKKTLCFRSGYGQVPLFARKRWPDTKVVVIDRDLLGTTFIRRNSIKLGLGGELLEVREAAHFPDAMRPDEKFDLVLGEISPSAGEAVLVSELNSILKSLSEGAEAILLCLEKVEREWLRPNASKVEGSLQLILKREGYTAIRLNR